MHEKSSDKSTAEQLDANPVAAQPWPPNEEVGDIYALEFNNQGQVESAEKLTDPPQIWVGSWLDYNNGRLYGQWIDAARDDEAIWSDIHTMLAASPTSDQTGEVAEDWGIFDFDNFGPLRIGEQESVAWVGKVARGIAEHGLAYAAYADVMQDEAALDSFTDDYLGEWPSLEAYVDAMADDCEYNRLLDEALPASIRAYVQIDTAALARDMQLGGDVHVIPHDQGVWLFHSI